MLLNEIQRQQAQLRDMQQQLAELQSSGARCRDAPRTNRSRLHDIWSWLAQMDRCQGALAAYYYLVQPGSSFAPSAPST
jgi:cell division septum initiation protein DivIVA